VRLEVERTPIDLPKGGKLHLTFSAGIASSPSDGERPDDLVTRADARLLAAKSSGRNRVLGPEYSVVR
jgi:diguanylate cyclase (GGDEF)-like protein